MPHSVIFDRQEALAHARTLRHVEPLGASKGLYAGEPLYDRVRDRDGTHYAYVSVTTGFDSRKFDFTQLAPGEFVLPPGIVYRRIEPPRAAKLSILKRLRWAIYESWRLTRSTPILILFVSS
jgi:hypothetical protein